MKANRFFFLLLNLAAGIACAAGEVQIYVLSNRADLISGGDALVGIVIAPGVDASSMRVTSGTRDVTAAFAVRADGRYLGRIDGLALGANVVTARLADGHGARITITNHPGGGPVFSGPQVQPWSCNPGATDALCTRAPSYQYFYVPVGIDPWATSGLIGAPDMPDAYFLTYDPANPTPAALIAQTTTDQGQTVPFIVRVETGSVDRGQYQIAVLYDPSKPWDYRNPQTGWNQKLFLVGGAGCGISYQEGAAPGVLYGKVLGRGFATMSIDLESTGNDCNMVVQAESLMMAKEHLIEAYGLVRYTFSIGGSGASIVQHWNANAYPGIYDGLIVEASFPDAWTEMVNTEDCVSLVSYWTDPTRWATGVVWNPPDQSAVEDGDAPSGCVAFAEVFEGLFTPADETGQVPASDVYDPQANPNGVRGTLWDYGIAQLGRRASQAWGPVERAIGYGFANRPLDTVGIQYGLKALMNGLITPAQFVDLNAKVGGHDIDYNAQPQRTLADSAALFVAYRSGYLNQANNLHVPIIDLRGTSNADLHDTFHSWSMRARLDRANGNHDNQIIWDSFTASGFVVDEALETQAFFLMDRWLSAIEADMSDRSFAQKVVYDKPSDAVDRCTVTGTDIAGPCVIPPNGTARLGAGEPLTDDTAKCQLKALNRTDYLPILFTDAQWQQLQQAFPAGVCDYNQAGVYQQATLPWLTYKNGPGGQPLGAAPQSESF
ncbi:MAG TPA: DUF6351 family protein [Burkholderiales bacterium]|nr:DUF6351 family protein [Burkholderiales bacterium]